MIAVLWAWSTAGATTLDEARAAAEQRAVDVQRQIALAEQASGVALEATAANLPDIALFGSVNTGSGFTAFGIQRPPSTQFGLGATGSWQVLSPSGWAAATAARRTAAGQRALAEWARATARRDATVAYAQALAAEETFAARQRAREDAARAAEAVASLAAAGVRPQADRARAQATAAARLADEVAVQGEVAAACAALQALIGEPVDGRCALEPVVWAAPAAGGPVEDHPALVAAAEALSAAEASRQATLLARAPSLAGEATIGEYLARSPEVGTSSGPGWNALLRLDVPLVASGGGVGRLRQATGARDAAAAALEGQARSLAQAAIAAEARFTSAQAAAAARDEAVRAADEALALVDGRYAQGLDDLEAWLAARRDRDDALVALAAAGAELGRALAELEAVRGVR